MKEEKTFAKITVSKMFKKTLTVAKLLIVFGDHGSGCRWNFNKDETVFTVLTGCVFEQDQGSL